MNRPRSHQIDLDSPEYIGEWARDIVSVAGKREARKILAGYEALARNNRLAKSDRDAAKERIKALKRHL